MGPQLVVAFVVETLDGSFLVVRLIRSTWPLVQGWFGLVSRYSMSFASQIHLARPGRVTVARLVSEMDAVAHWEAPVREPRRP